LTAGLRGGSHPLSVNAGNAKAFEETQKRQTKEADLRGLGTASRTMSIGQ
jgi:hypothetical protein